MRPWTANQGIYLNIENMNDALYIRRIIELINSPIIYKEVYYEDNQRLKGNNRVN